MKGVRFGPPLTLASLCSPATARDGRSPSLPGPRGRSPSPGYDRTGTLARACPEHVEGLFDNPIPHARAADIAARTKATMRAATFSDESEVNSPKTYDFNPARTRTPIRFGPVISSDRTGSAVCDRPGAVLTDGNGNNVEIEVVTSLR